MIVNYDNITFIVQATGITVVQHLTHIPKIKSTNPANSAKRENSKKRLL
jgi:hypothetical protein